MIRRNLLALTSTVALIAGLLMGAAPGALAADLGTVTVSGSSSAPSLSASSLTAQVGDTFSVTNSITGGTTDVSVKGPVTRNRSGSLTDCSASSPYCTLSNGDTDTYAIDQLGTVEVYLYPGGSLGALIGTITLGANSGSSSDSTNLALVYPTATFDPNGGSCTGTLQYSKYNGQNNSVTTPTSDECNRDGYDLLAWSRSAGGVHGSAGAWKPGVGVPIGNESFTLYAIWSPKPGKISVTYDANLGPGVECLIFGEVAATSLSREVVVDVDSPAAANMVVPYPGTTAIAPCSPANAALAGWALTGDGPVAFRAGAPLPELTSSYRLYAKWETTYGITIAGPFGSGDIRSVTVSATENGSPAKGVELGISATGAVGWVGESTTDSRGEASYTLYSKDNADLFGTFTAAYGDKTATVSLAGSGVTPTPPSPPPPPTPPTRAPKPTPVAEKSIAITGERGTVKGKPGVLVDGDTTGFAEGDAVVPWIKFPGQTTYSEGSARPKIDESGEFYWQRKTGKKIYIYFTNEDGSVKSDRIIIQAK